MGHARGNAVFAMMALATVAAETATGTARAQSRSRNPAASQALYDEARRLAHAGKYSEACPKFKESHQLDPGGGTLLNLADCYEKEGKLALAWSTFKEALVVAQRDGRDDRVDFASHHIGAIESRLALLTVSVSSEARAAPGLAVAVDGTSLGDAAFGVALPIDPGKHVVRAEAPGKQPFTASIDIPPTDAVRQTVEIPKLEDTPGGEGRAPGPITASVDSESGTSNTRATLGWIVGGVGVVSVSVGGYFGLQAISQWDQRNKACANGCTRAAQNAGDDANRDATISDIAFGAGLAAVGVGTYLILTSHGTSHPSGSATFHVAPVAFREGAALLLRGDF